MKAFDAIMQILNEKGFEPDTLPFASLHQEGVVSFPVANIATTLDPNVEIHPDSKAFIVGNDGPNLTAKDYPWIGILGKWLHTGCDINYLLLEPSEKTLDVFRPLLKANNPGKLSVYGIDRNAASTEAVAMIKQWKTFHFAVFENPRQLWVESDHKPQDTEARDCYFFPKEVAKTAGLVDVLKSKFEYILKTCGVDLTPKN